jgi:hypothetical protein
MEHRLMNLKVERYLDQSDRWPKDGRHILAQFDADSIVVYQAYRPEIGRFAIENGRLGGPHFSCGRMSWIKAKLPLDDVPLWLGDKGKPGSRSRRATAS